MRYTLPNQEIRWAKCDDLQWVTAVVVFSNEGRPAVFPPNVKGSFAFGVVFSLVNQTFVTYDHFASIKQTKERVQISSDLCVEHGGHPVRIPLSARMKMRRIIWNVNLTFSKDARTVSQSGPTLL